MVVATVVAIGCGSGKPGAASATSESQAQAEAPIRLAEATATADPSSSGGSASVQGAIRFVGTAPTQGKVKMDADPVCQQQHPTSVFSEEVLVNANGTLRHVFVYVKEGVSGPFPPPARAVTLDQAGCWYHPHVFGIQVNQPLEIVNSDPTLHNVNAKPVSNQPFNVAQPVKGMKTTKKFAKPEIMVRFKCNVHPWMSAYVGVVEHPFFSVSGADGSFSLTGLPAGTYVLEAWHEKYGTQTQTVNVADGETKSIELTFTAQ
jgi:hypothetical protein